MKALDTSVLLALLEGDQSARELVRKLRDVEIVTTEANFLELAYVAARGSARIRGRRREALGRLRRKLTVLSIDPRAVAEAEGRVLRGDAPSSPLVSGMLGAFEAAGCDELFTSDPQDCRGRWRFRVTRFTRRASK
ncbi:MAG TPA: PIN domain-containing protein [Thermoplasmata archaeon]|nr:PIN domain-containing protein [Thermoplasmata archaeon]